MQSLLYRFQQYVGLHPCVGPPVNPRTQPFPLGPPTGIGTTGRVSAKFPSQVASLLGVDDVPGVRLGLIGLSETSSAPEYTPSSQVPGSPHTRTGDRGADGGLTCVDTSVSFCRGIRTATA